MLGAMSEVGLVVRLHKLGLLPEANRKTFVKTIYEDLRQDDHRIRRRGLGAHGNEQQVLRSVFTDEEFEEMKERLRRNDEGQAESFDRYLKSGCRTSLQCDTVSYLG
jgi:hypothetical protein